MQIFVKKLWQVIPVSAVSAKKKEEMMFIVTELIRLKSESFFDLHVEIGMPWNALECPDAL